LEFGPSMELKRYRLRPFEEADYDALVELDREAFPESPPTAEDERQWDRILAVDHRVNEKWVVEERESGQVVASAGLNHTPYSYDSHKFWVWVFVRSSHRHRGIGRALASLLDAEATAHHAICFWASVRKGDDRNLDFAGRQGFVELRTTWMSVLDLHRVDLTSFEDRTSALQREGIRFTTLAEEGPRDPSVRRRIYELWSETSRDVPRMGPYTPSTFAEFAADLDGPSTIPEAFFLAAHGETYVGSSNLNRDLASPDALIVGYTGVRSAFRGKGLAKELKRRTAEYARGNHIRYLRTFNDSLNHPIWAINEKMGFLRTVELSQQERRFRPDPPAPESSPGPPAGSGESAGPPKSLPR